MTNRDDQKLQVQQATDLVRLIGEQIALRPKGKEFLGLCPFHDDKSPSMHVSPAKQIFKCFSCGAGGDAFSFVMNYHKMSFPEALKLLADRAGIKLQEWRGQSDDRGEGPSERELLAIANARAMQFFRGCYNHSEHGREARAYVDRRGIHPDMIEAFQIGYAPDRWDGLVQMIGAKAWDMRSFVFAGLLKSREDGGHYDALRHRLIFPILDALGRPIAFGGRKLREEDEPKYLNSPETKLFNKSATLYGLHLAKKPIIDSRVAVIVEGYTDVIACHQAGVANVVATLGTALTPQHAAELRRYCDKVVLIFDADAAGQKAADRAVEVFLTGDIDVAIAVLPSPTGEKVDPAELLALEDGLEQWKAAIEAAQDALDYQFDRVRQELSSQTTLSGRQRVAEGYIQKLATLGIARTGILKSAMVRTRLADLLHLSESEVASLIQRFAPRRVTPQAQPPASQDEDRATMPDDNNVGADVALPVSKAKLNALRLAELELIGCLIRRNDLFHALLPDGHSLDEAITVSEMVTDDGRRLYQWMHDRLADGQTLSLASMLGNLAAEGEHALVQMATTADADLDAKGFDDAALPSHALAMAEALVKHSREMERLTQRMALLEQVRTAGGEEMDAARRIIEQARTGASPLRIARVSA
jgi:DNA primase